MKQKEKYFRILALIFFAGLIIYLFRVGMGGKQRGKDANIHLDLMGKAEKVKTFQPAKEIVKPAGFINTEGIKIEDLIGKKVILVDFWTFSCINCQRTFPYINSWYEKYKDKGLEIIGVHTPEFSFEKEYDNVLSAVDRYNLKYPIVLDNDYATWNAYKNQYWPRKYLIDIDGFIVYDHIGEGGYEETERKIQELLEERMKVLGETGKIDNSLSKPEGVESVDASVVRSPEIYFGASRNSYLGNGAPGVVGPQSLVEPQGVKANILYMVGDWDFDGEFAENKSKGAKIIFRYTAQKVFLVASSENKVNAKILIDGKNVSLNMVGSDVDNSTVIIERDRLYRLIENDSSEEHTLEIIINEPGVKIFTFTFG